MHKWYVLQVLSSHEDKVKQAIEDLREHHNMGELIEEVMIPTEKVQEVKKGEPTVVQKRLWPGYILIKMTLTDESWHYIKQTQSVIDFLGGGQPTALTEMEVEEILQDLAKKKDTIVQKHQFDVGDSVKIIDGVFVNFIGTVTDVYHDKGRLSVLVSIFGRETQVDDLEFVQVEEVTEETEIN